MNIGMKILQESVTKQPKTHSNISSSFSVMKPRILSKYLVKFWNWQTNFKATYPRKYIIFFYESFSVFFLHSSIFFTAIITELTFVLFEQSAKALCHYERLIFREFNFKATYLRKYAIFFYASFIVFILDSSSIFTAIITVLAFVLFGQSIKAHYHHERSFSKTSIF